MELTSLSGHIIIMIYERPRSPLIRHTAQRVVVSNDENECCQENKRIDLSQPSEGFGWMRKSKVLSADDQPMVPAPSRCW